MGSFSWDCEACKFSMRDCPNCSEGGWMAQGVCLTPDGSRVFGYYNGYGQLGEYSLAGQIGKFSIYHRACWELVGKPEYTQPARHASDQGFCHAMHGHPFPLPTHAWLEKARMWDALDRVITKYWDVRADIDMRETEDKFALFTKEGQERLCREYLADRKARSESWRALWDAYLHSPDESALAPVKDEPKEFLYECIHFDYDWLGVVVSRATGEHYY